MKGGRRELFSAIAAKHTPDGYDLEFVNRNYGRAVFSRRLLRVPKPKTLLTLHIYLHECGHVHCGHFKRDGKSRHRQEYEAEVYAFEAIEAEGLEPDPRSVERAKKYVRYKIRQAVRRRAKYIDGEAMGFAGLTDSDLYVLRAPDRPDQLGEFFGTLWVTTIDDDGVMNCKMARSRRARAISEKYDLTADDGKQSQ